MRYRLLALDLDGTLTNSEKKVTPRTKQALLRAQERGVRIALTSGRPVQGIEPLAELLELPRYGGFVAAYNGGRIFECATKKTICEEFLPAGAAARICAFGANFDVSMVAYRGDAIVTQDAGNKYVRFDASVNHMALEEAKDLAARIDFPIHKFLMAGEPPYIAALLPKAKAAFPDLSVYCSDPFYLEFMPLGGNKARGLAVLLEQLGLTKEDLMACGDGFNDVSMVRFAGLGVAMANAQAPVLEVADHVTASNDEDGVALAVERFLLEGTE